VETATTQSPQNPSPAVAANVLTQLCDLNAKIDRLDAKLEAIAQIATPITNNAPQPPTINQANFKHPANQTTVDFPVNQFDPSAFQPVSPEPQFTSSSCDQSSSDRQPVEDLGDRDNLDRDPAPESPDQPESDNQPPSPEPIAWEVWAYLERRRKDTLRQVETFDSEWQANRFLEQAERERKAGLRVHYEIRPILPEVDLENEPQAEQNGQGDSVDGQNSADRNDHNKQEPAIDVEVIATPAQTNPAPNNSSTNPTVPESDQGDRPDQQSDLPSTPPPDPPIDQHLDQDHANDTIITEPELVAETVSPTNSDPPAIDLDLETIPAPPAPLSKPKADVAPQVAKPLAAPIDPDVDLDELEDLDSWQVEQEMTIPKHLTQAELAQRLAVSNSTLNRHKLNPNFAEWCRKQPKQKPRGELWQYNPGDDLFHRLDQ
jgi:hypothetical protein